MVHLFFYNQRTALAGIDVEFDLFINYPGTSKFILCYSMSLIQIIYLFSLHSIDNENVS